MKIISVVKRETRDFSRAISRLGEYSRTRRNNFKGIRRARDGMYGLCVRADSHDINPIRGTRAINRTRRNGHGLIHRVGITSVLLRIETSTSIAELRHAVRVRYR